MPDAYDLDIADIDTYYVGAAKRSYWSTTQCRQVARRDIDQGAERPDAGKSIIDFLKDDGEEVRVETQAATTSAAPAGVSAHGRTGKSPL